MASDWTDKYQIQLVTDDIEAAKIVSPEGNVSFNAVGSFGMSLAVASAAFNWHPEIPEPERSGIAFSAVSEAGKLGAITPDSLRAKFRAKQSEYLARPMNPYVLLTSISVKPDAVLRRARIGHSTIIFERNPPDRFLAARNTIQEARGLPEYLEHLPEQLGVRIHVAGRSIHDAAYRALQDFDLLRSIWNLGRNMPTDRRWSIGSRRPVNSILLGPLHTLHLPNGRLATETWWYEAQYQQPTSLVDLSANRSRMYKFDAQVRRVLNRLTYGDLVQNAILKYGRALDYPNWRNAFLQLWNVLEDVTFTGGKNYDVTIKRASFVWKEHQYHRQVLEYLRDLRNSFVHESTTSNELEMHLYHLKRYVEEILRFHLVNGKRFESRAEVEQFLDLPKDARVLAKKIDLLRRAARYRTS
jgi:hypothetical protein